MGIEEQVFDLKCLQKRTARKRFRYEIFQSWNNVCAYCGSERSDTLDHIVPRAKGGLTKIGNLLSCCAACNLSKSDQDWLMWYRIQPFWDETREGVIWKWLEHNHEYHVEARRFMESCCEEPPLLPPSTS